MIDDLLHALSIRPQARVWAARVNRLPLPYARLPVRVHGHRMVAPSLDRLLALWLWKLNLLGRQQTAALSAICRPGMRVVDVGANIGHLSLLLAGWVGPAGKVWAFEPDPDNFAALRRNLQQSGYANATPVPLAVGAASGRGALHRSAAHGGDHRIYATDEPRATAAIDITTLDDFFGAERLDLIKLDIQGAEGLALYGMRDLLERNRALTIAMELWPAALRRAGSDPAALLEDLRRQGFSLAHLDGSGAGCAIDAPAAFVAQLGDRRYVDLLARRQR